MRQSMGWKKREKGEKEKVLGENLL